MKPYRIYECLCGRWVSRGRWRTGGLDYRCGVEESYLLRRAGTNNRTKAQVVAANHDEVPVHTSPVEGQPGSYRLYLAIMVDRTRSKVARQRSGNAHIGVAGDKPG
jgi:hypothetical protein